MIREAKISVILDISRLLVLQYFFSLQKHCIVLLALLFSCSLFSQNSIKGTVVDSVGNGFPFVSIALRNTPDSLNTKGTISDESGNYEFVNIRPGRYALTFFSVGYPELQSGELLVDSFSKSIVPAMVLKGSGIHLNEVSVTSLKKVIEFKNGMTVLNVENSIMAAGNTVLDVLKRIPGVTVDNKNNISISGKQGVRIMMDGRLQQFSMEQIVSMLSAMTADQLSKIEVMKNPPVKYDAEGNAGMINIVTKKVTTKGYSGSISYNPGMGQRFGNSVFATLNFKSNKLTVFSNINPMYKTFYDRYDYHKRVSYMNRTTLFDHTGDHENLRKYISGKIGADYQLSKKTTVGVALSNTINHTDAVENGFVVIGGYNDVGFDYYKYVTKDNSLWSNPSYNFNAEHKFDTLGTTLNLSVDDAEFNSTSDRKSESVFYNNENAYAKQPQIYQSTNNAKVSLFTQKIDFQKYLKPSWLMETGAKTTFVNSHSDFVFERMDTLTGILARDTGFTNLYQYKENVIAAYLNIRKEFKKGSASIGARVEQTEITGHNFTNGFRLTRNYINIFPNVSFDYQLNSSQTLQFGYNRRLDRPDYSQLNPFKHFEDQYAVGAGNPYLNPQYSDNVDVVHVYKEWITNSIGFAHFTQMFSGISYQNDSTKVTTFTEVNLDQSNYYYYNLFLQKQLKQWWSTEFSLNVYYINYKSRISSALLDVNTLSCNVYLNNDFVLPRDFKIQLTMRYNAPNRNGPNYNKANGTCDFGIKKTLLKGKFNIMFQFLDMFYTDISRNLYNFDNQYYTFNSRNDTRRFRLTLSYKFGRMNIKVNEKHSNDQENGRLKKE